MSQPTVGSIKDYRPILKEIITINKNKFEECQMLVMAINIL